MSNDAHVPEEAPDATAPRDVQDFVLQLDFVPTWARKPADNPYGSGGAPAFREERPRDDRRDRRPDRRGPGGPGGAGGGMGGAGKRPGQGGQRPPPRGGAGSRDARDGRDSRGRPEQRSYVAAPRIYLPLEISFIPEREQLSSAVRQLHATQKAFPLAYLAGLFLARPEGHLIKVDLRGGGSEGLAGTKLFQCTSDGAVFMDAEGLKAHAITHHLPDIYEEQEVPVEVPAGNFNCVGRCRLSGQLLGPPNYHGYQDRLLNLYRSRFTHLSVDEYRNQIEMVRDPAVVEQWKESCRVQKVYRVKGQAEGEGLKREEAVAQFVSQRLPGLQKVGTRFMIPAQAVKLMEGGALRRQIEEAWSKENRFPLSLMLALRPAFKRMRLHLFKAGRGETFVTAIVPKAMDSEHAVDELKAMLTLIRQHPGWNRAALVEHLQPGLGIDSEEAGRLLSPLRWLIEKGHVIEFFNGTLSAPSMGGVHREAAKAPAANPVPEAAPEQAPVAEAVSEEVQVAVEVEPAPIPEPLHDPVPGVADPVEPSAGA